MFVISLSDWLNIHFFPQHKIYYKNSTSFIIRKAKQIAKSFTFFEILIAQAINTKYEMDKKKWWYIICWSIQSIWTTQISENI